MGGSIAILKDEKYRSGNFQHILTKVTSLAHTKKKKKKNGLVLEDDSGLTQTQPSGGPKYIQFILYSIFFRIY